MDTRAQWAQFLDLIGALWIDQTEELELDGKSLRPEFFVSYQGQEFLLLIREVKDAHRIKPQRVYLAGKMRPEHDWRGPTSPLVRHKRGGVSYYDLYTDPKQAWATRGWQGNLLNTAFEVAGPFPSACDHGCAHADSSLHMAQTCSDDAVRKNIVAASYGAIDSCDILCAHFNTADGFATLVEIGRARDKRVCVTLTVDLATKLSRKSKSYEECGIMEQIFAHGAHDLWFACDVADASQIVINDEEARKVHGAFIRQHTDHEYRLLSDAAQRHAVVVAFGNPLKVSRGEGSFLQWGVPKFRSYLNVDKASKACGC